jgi:uncharacterized protein YgbK (DUF1537 family)
VQPWRILADDLTGAADAALAFWAPGVRVRVSLPGDAPVAADVHALATLWRDDPAGEARFAAALPPTPERLLVKVDSTLREPAPAIVAACQARWPGARLVLCPALPAQGRTVRGGILRVYGRPVRIPPGLPPLHDAETDADLAALVRHAPPGTLWVGSSGLAAALAGHPPPAPRPGSPDGPRVLVVAGSAHPATQAQLREIRDPVVYDAGVGGALAAGYPALAVTGGHTAAALLRALDLGGMDVLGAAGPGIPLARAGRWLVATKAGGFGDAGALARACDALRAALREGL